MVDEFSTGAQSDGGGDEPPAIRGQSRAAFTLALHRAIDQRGLSLERDLFDWFGEDRLTELLDGAVPSPEETAVMARLTGDSLFLSPTDTPPDDMEPIAPDVEPAFPTSAVIASISTSVAFAAVLVAGVVFHTAAELRNDAVEAEAFSARLVTTLAEELPHDGNSGVFEAIAADALAHFRSTPSIDDPQTLRDWSRLFTIVGCQRWNAGDTRGAREAFETAVVATERRANDAPGDINAVFDLSQAVFWLADFNYRNGDFDAAETGYDTYAALTAQLFEADPDRPLYQAEYAYGYLNTAIMDFERGRLDVARDGFLTARTGLETVDQHANIVSGIDIANASAWLADTLFATGHLEAAADERAAEVAFYEAMEPRQRLAEIQQVRALSRQSQALLALGEVDEVRLVVERGLEQVDALLDETPGDVDIQRQYIALMAKRAELQLIDGNAITAKLILDSALGEEANALEGGTRIVPAREAAFYLLLSADIALELGAIDEALSDARAALDLLESGRSDIFSVFKQAHAYETIGQAHLLAGQRTLAERAWRQGYDALGRGLGHFLEDVYRARLAYRIGDLETATASYARLQNLGYAHPLDSAFWREASNAGVVQREVQGDMNDG